MEIPRGRFNWVEFVTTDPEAAADFYTHTIGWTVSEMKMEGGDLYRILEAGGRGMGGIFTVTPQQQNQGMATGWVGYITTPDVDGDVTRLERARGTVHRAPYEIPGVGRIAAVSDPQGAGFLLMHPKPPEGAKAPPPATGPGALGWAELTTPDPKGAFAFYTELLGWKSERVTPLGEGIEYHVFSTGAEPGGGIMTGTKPGAKPAWLYYFNVDGLTAAVNRLTSKGGKLINSPQKVPTGDWVATAADPLGGVFALTSKSK